MYGRDAPALRQWPVVAPKEADTPEGEMRFLMLREMFRAVALQGRLDTHRL
jgi:hypothetical protein